MLRFMKLRAVAMIALALSACGGGPSPTPPPPAPPVPAFEASWLGPNIGVQLWCEQDTPVPCQLPPGATWGTFNRPGNSGFLCVDPNPNPCFSTASGVFVSNPTDNGFPIITRASFPRTGKLTLSASISATCPDAGCWGGPVLYNGESNYRAIYLAIGSDGKMHLGMWGPAYRQDFPEVIEPGTTHSVSIIYSGGVWTYIADGVVEPVLEHDPVLLTDDPHVAVFAGGISLSVGTFEVFTDP